MAARARLLVIGLDGASWDVAAPLMADGRLPRLKQLVDSGFSSPLQTIQPTLSPIIWTTIATGKAPSQHGVHHFLARNPDTGQLQPVTSNMRRVKAFWNILSDYGRPCGVVGWWITWPAESIDGVIVSSYSAVKSRIWKPTIFQDFERQTHPEQFMDVVRPIIDACESAAHEHLRDRVFEQVDLSALNAVQKTVVQDTRDVFLSDEIFSRTAAHLIESRADLDVVAVYLGGIDVASHRFWKYMEPDGLDAFRTTVAEVEMLGGIIERYYEYVDEIIGRLSDLDPGRSVVILSDHGFQAETEPYLSQDERSGGHEQALLPGMLVMSGGLFTVGSHVEPPYTNDLPTVHDILPTLLCLLRLPVAEDLEGRVIEEAIRPEILATCALETVPTFERPGEPATHARPIASQVDDALNARLEKLGYIGSEWREGREPTNAAGGDGRD